MMYTQPVSAWDTELCSAEALVWQNGVGLGLGQAHGAGVPRTGGHDVVADEEHVRWGERQQEQEAVCEHVCLHRPW